LHRCKWHAFLNWLPQIKQSVCCAIGKVKAINNCVACILQSTVHGATQPRFHLQLWQDIAAERAIAKPILLDCQKRQTAVCVGTAGCVAACLQSGTNIKTLM